MHRRPTNPLLGLFNGWNEHRLTQYLWSWLTTWQAACFTDPMLHKKRAVPKQQQRYSRCIRPISGRPCSQSRILQKDKPLTERQGTSQSTQCHLPNTNRRSQKRNRTNVAWSVEWWREMWHEVSSDEEKCGMKCRVMKRNVAWSVEWWREMWHEVSSDEEKCGMKCRVMKRNVTWSVEWWREMWHEVSSDEEKCDMKCRVMKRNVTWSVEWWREMWHEV